MYVFCMISSEKDKNRLCEALSARPIWLFDRMVDYELKLNAKGSGKSLGSVVQFNYVSAGCR
jgi:hypothetical protein